ncbi:MAG: DUF115 domain-containing protein [Planctomycetota bacterium]|nr:DUF115 domain-containing protein [Planctomycetota bacterium]
MKALSVRCPELAKAVEAVDLLPEESILTTKDGSKTVEYYTAEGQRILLASRYRPLEEAKRLADSLETDPMISYFVLGMGVGYHVLELFRRRTAGTRIVVIESDLQIFKTSLALQDFVEMIEDPQMFFFVGSDGATLYEGLRKEVFRIFSSPVVIVPHRASMQVNGGYYQDIKRQLSEFVASGSMIVRTALILSRKSFENRMANLLHYVAAPGINVYRNHYQGKPGFLISAGPSLHQNMDLLSEIQGRGVLVAVSTALKPVLASNIQPDFTVLLDYHEVSRRYFDRIDPEVAKKIPLLVDPKATSAAIEAYNGPLVFGGDQLNDTLLKEIPIHKGDFPQGSTVAHTAFFVLQMMGCDPIVFVGQDLAYTHGVTHVPGTSIFNQWRPELNRFHTLEWKEWEQIVRMRGNLSQVRTANGADVYTDEQMLSYRKEFEMSISLDGSERKYINATGGGAHIEGTEVLSLREVIDRWCVSPVPVSTEPLPEVTPARRRDIYQMVRKSLEIRLEECLEMKDGYRECLQLFEKIQAKKTRGKPYNHHILRLHEIRDDFVRFGHMYFLLTHMALSDNLTRDQADRRMEAEKLFGHARQDRQIERDVDFIRSLSSGLEHMEEMLSDRLELLHDWVGSLESGETESGE